MTHATRLAALAILAALALCVPVQAQTPEIDALRVRAEAGDAEAQDDLGIMYANGRGVPEDDAEAVRWFRLAADQGVGTAQSNLGVMYHTGDGVTQDYAEPMRWYRLAADQGYARAQSNLGLLYENGEGVSQDYVQAHMWTNLAVAQSSGEDRDRRERNRDIIAAKMTAEQVVEAQRLAREWDEAHPREP